MEPTYFVWKRLEEERHRQTRLAQARQAAWECAHRLYETYGVQRVYLIGSVARGTFFHERSDIDLVVEGLPPQRYFQALADLWRRLPPGMELDLIPLEDAHPELRALVLQEGVVLDEPVCRA
ncbi:MAG: nucleotidyltransferase domain-containing protein [candidate division WOR-3 bacterium]